MSSSDGCIVGRVDGLPVVPNASRKTEINMSKRQNTVNSFSVVIYSGSLGQYVRLAVGIFSTVQVGLHIRLFHILDSVLKELFSVMVAAWLAIYCAGSNEIWFR